MIVIVTLPHNYNMCMPCSQMSSETPQNVLTQQYHGMHHLSNAGDGELLGGLVLIMCTREIYSSHGIPVSNQEYLCSYIAVQILVRGLHRVPNPSSLFVPNKAMLEWAFRQQGLASGAARSWVRRVDCCLPTQALQREKEKRNKDK